MSPASAIPLPSSHTKRFTNVTMDDIYPDEKVIVAGNATEHRGKLSVWDDVCETTSDRVISIVAETSEYITVIHGDQDNLRIALKDESALRELTSGSRLLIDISGLPHHVWAPLLKVAYQANILTRVLYAEPDSYKQHPTPASATVFDLSVSFGGLAPLPGFACLTGPEDESKCLFVALLGFEGNRPERLADQIDPPPKVVPIVGVPGFKIEFPASTVACNRGLLNEYRAYADIRYARASCPFEVFSILEEIRKDFPEHYMYLAPVGTKPHSLGAVWYAIANPDHTEIMFDFPKRKSGRTTGIGVIHIYDFGAFNVC